MGESMADLDDKLQALNGIAAKAKVAIDASEQKSELEAVRIEYLGKKGLITAYLKQLGEVSVEQRPVIGKSVNLAKREVASLIDVRFKALAVAALNAALEAEKIDVIVHIMTPHTRSTYNLEKLWQVPDDMQQQVSAEEE